MAKRNKMRGAKASAVALVRAGGKAEQRLLQREQRAEQALKSALDRLKKAQVRLERRLSAVADAEALLRSRQSARAIGPDGAANAPADDSLVLLSPTDPGSNGAAPEVNMDAAASATSTAAPKRPTRRKTATPTGPEPSPAEVIVPAAERAAPRRRHRSTAAKTPETSS